MRVIVRGIEPDASRWVTPFPEQFPDFRVNVKDLPREQGAKIAQKYGMSPAKPAAKDYPTQVAYTRELFEVQFGGAEGEEQVFGAKLGDNIKPYIETLVEREGKEGDADRAPCTNCGHVDKSLVVLPLFLFCVEVSNNARAVEIKNS